MKKLAKSTIPNNHTFNDFKCFGKFATKDCEFDNTMTAYLGSFEQELKNSNKFYLACICNSNINNKWYVYCEWGRVGLKADFQFSEFDSEELAFKHYKKQCESKNTKRGIVKDHPVLGRILTPKPGKDLYMVRNMAKIQCNLPDACTITTIKPVVSNKKTLSNLDYETQKLLNDLKVGTISYARSKFSSGMIPDIEAIEQARKILSLGAKSKQKDLEDLTKMLYSKIPKRTYLGEKIVLSKDNIKEWYDDLDAFESAYKSENTQELEDISTKYSLKYIDKTNQVWYNIQRLVEQSTRNRHSYIPKKIEILNIWEITNLPDDFIKTQEEVSKEFKGNYFPLIFQPKRTDLENSSNCQLLFHGSRSVNIGKILQTGYKLPKELSGVQINGWVNGPGIYHGSDWRKSAGYCSIKNSYWAKGSGAISSRKAFMFINDVILGNPYIISYPKSYDNPPNGFHSVIADTKGSFQNEEFVVYNTKMFYPRYLIEFNL